MYDNDRSGCFSIILIILIPITLFGAIWLGFNTFNADSPEELAIKSRQLFDKINEERAEEGVGKLIWDKHIAESAIIHSVFMAQTDNYEHSNTPYAENIMVGSDPEEVFEAWDESTLHHSIMLDPEYHYGGVGMGLVLSQYKFGDWTITYNTSHGYSTFMASR